MAKVKTESAECCFVFACDGAGGLFSNIYLAAGSGSAGSTGGRGIKEHQYLQGYCQVREHVLCVGVRLFNIMQIIGQMTDRPSGGLAAVRSEPIISIMLI